MTVTEERTYMSSEVARLTGLSYRQLDYWLRCNVLGSLNVVGRVGLAHRDPRHPGSGGKRLWSASCLPVLCVLGVLNEMGAGHAVLRRVADEAGDLDLGARWLVVGPSSISCSTDPAELAEAVLSAQPGGYVVDLRAVEQRVMR